MADCFEMGLPRQGFRESYAEAGARARCPGAMCECVDERGAAGGRYVKVGAGKSVSPPFCAHFPLHPRRSRTPTYNAGGTNERLREILAETKAGDFISELCDEGLIRS